MIIFGLFVFFIMLFLSGIALDIIRFESERAMMQNTLDRAILAAADIENTLPAKDVVDSYFTTAGLDASKVTTTPSMDDGFKQVRATTSVKMSTWFMHIFDIDYLQAPAAGTAREGYGHVEISLVLDVSGSMGYSVGSSTRIKLLHGAAREIPDQDLRNQRSRRCYEKPGDCQPGALRATGEPGADGCQLFQSEQ